MSKSVNAIVVTALLVAAIPSAALAQATQTLVMTPGKGVSFYMGTKHGVTTFLSEGGACQLTVAIGDNPGMDGMNPTTSTRFTAAVMPGRPANLETTDGHSLKFTCGPGAQEMKLEMPPGFKLQSK